jgi:hypothetical protein
VHVEVLIHCLPAAYLRCVITMTSSRANINARSGPASEDAGKFMARFTTYKGLRLISS